MATQQKRTAPTSTAPDAFEAGEIRQDPGMLLNAGEQHLHPPEIETPSLLDVVPENVRLAAFMEEEVEVFVQLSKGERKEVPVTVTVNGVRQHIFRGLPQTIKRKYLEPLGRSINVDYEQDQERMYMSGDLPVANTSQTYPFTVLRDSVEGIVWLRELQMRG